MGGGGRGQTGTIDNTTLIPLMPLILWDQVGVSRDSLIRATLIPCDAADTVEAGRPNHRLSASVPVDSQDTTGTTQNCVVTVTITNTVINPPPHYDNFVTVVVIFRVITIVSVIVSVITIIAVIVSGKFVVMKQTTTVRYVLGFVREVNTYALYGTFKLHQHARPLPPKISSVPCPIRSSEGWVGRVGVLVGVACLTNR